MSFILFLYGTILASFITLCAYRIPNHVSIFYPRSYCDQCNHQLRYWQLIPIIGFILQRGKCYDCRQRITPLSTLLELFAGFIAIHAPYHHLINLFAFILFYSALLFITATDWQQQFFYSFGLIGLLPGISLFSSHHHWTLALLISLVATLVFLLLLSQLTNGLGVGDIELILIFEMLVGFYATLQIILISSSLAILLLIFIHKQQRIAFVPFLSLGFICVTQFLFYM
ncbi:hypothetical protein FC70_GL000818 [Paucilactobacillus oligofermentans DSM 15707 = LMG 22743]|uniref:Uncharacterized protein n=1 Tax=Paucilactobacillus oligofermentans DSM 15707 = LMG 22743 TaxID=1423778 RepID=A0A0R1REL0_9LACO|nr:A24 family peptidase [Paucilactobacillus oligofermentans]KRL55222.1 hypothetical protein FC70_GL000818 [Paucilactobacillus oligofermentans DSM 15707 = LMG 22743]CUS25788.1 Type 4 prepilin peptidase [Paucilactobacillus oligofermentans DSM 15707 = LMG 22743]